MDISVKKVVIDQPGSGYHRLRCHTETHRFQLKDEELLIEVSAAGVNYADCLIRWGVYESAKKFSSYPMTPGFEFSGVVLRVGKGVRKFEVGQKVFGLKLFGAQTSHLVVEQDTVFLKPEHLSLQEAATVPVVFLTAYHGLIQNTVLRRGMKVLVHSAAGGVGSALVQLAKNHGCSVCGVVGSGKKISYLEGMGADYTIDKSVQKLWYEAKKIAPLGWDIICDANGVSTLNQSYAHLAPTGKLLVYGFHSMFPKIGGRLNWLRLAIDYIRTPRFNPFLMTAANRGVYGFNLSFLMGQKKLLLAGMEELLDLFSAGRLRPLPVTSFDVEDVVKAHQFLESGQSTGKITLTF